jgi:hypothetical protein
MVQALDHERRVKRARGHAIVEFSHRATDDLDVLKPLSHTAGADHPLHNRHEFDGHHGFGVAMKPVVVGSSVSRIDDLVECSIDDLESPSPSRASSAG